LPVGLSLLENLIKDIRISVVSLSDNKHGNFYPSLALWSEPEVRRLSIQTFNPRSDNGDRQSEFLQAPGSFAEQERTGGAPSSEDDTTSANHGEHELSRNPKPKLNNRISEKEKVESLLTVGQKTLFEMRHSSLSFSSWDSAEGCHPTDQSSW
jgi:hypothetical protein